MLSTVKYEGEKKYSSKHIWEEMCLSATIDLDGHSCLGFIFRAWDFLRSLWQGVLAHFSCSAKCLSSRSNTLIQGMQTHSLHFKIVLKLNCRLLLHGQLNAYEFWIECWGMHQMSMQNSGFVHCFCFRTSSSQWPWSTIQHSISRTGSKSTYCLSMSSQRWGMAHLFGVVHFALFDSKHIDAIFFLIGSLLSIE